MISDGLRFRAFYSSVFFFAVRVVFALTVFTAFAAFVVFVSAFTVVLAVAAFFVVWFSLPWF